MNQFDPLLSAGVMGGKACIRGMRVTVGNEWGKSAPVQQIEELLQDYPHWSAKTSSKLFLRDDTL